MRIIKLNIISLLFILQTACSNIYTQTPPYTITTPKCELGGISFEFFYAGISFSFLNKSEKSISSITASFMLFDGKTQTSPFIGSNKFEIKKLTLISPGENRDVLISLDNFIFIAPIEPYLIDFFYISKIEYTDGSIWEDKYGIFRI